MKVAESPPSGSLELRRPRSSAVLSSQVPLPAGIPSHFSYYWPMARGYAYRVLDNVSGQSGHTTICEEDVYIQLCKSKAISVRFKMNQSVSWMCASTLPRGLTSRRQETSSPRSEATECNSLVGEHRSELPQLRGRLLPIFTPRRKKMSERNHIPAPDSIP